MGNYSLLKVISALLKWLLVTAAIKIRQDDCKTSPPQSNLRRVRRSLADKTSSNLLGLHSTSMLSPFKMSLAEWDLARLGTRRMRPYAGVCCLLLLLVPWFKNRSKMSACYNYWLHGRIAILRLFLYVFAHEFLFNPQFDLEPDYIYQFMVNKRWI